MRIIVLLALVITIGCILAAGCVAQTKKEPVNISVSVSPANTFTPFTNVTNASNITVTSGLKGPLRVSIGGWDAALPVYIDNKSTGSVVTKDKPLDLMLEEGNHTVKVCTGVKCEEENVTIQFARQRLVNFEERLITDVGFPNPTARIIGYNSAGSRIIVNVEFINPTSEDLSMSAIVRCGYSYIEDRSNSRVGSIAEDIVTAYVPSGKRVTDAMESGLASGYSYIYSVPVISGITTSSTE